MPHDHGKQKAIIPNAYNDWKIPDRYVIRTLIGSGSYGQVCECYDKETKEVVAIKKIHKVFEDLIDCKRILREIAILNRLEHELIVRIINICVPDDLSNFDELYIVLEIADSDFKRLFRTPVYLSELHVKTLLYNLLVGLKHVHSAGIYHRDLKPANCLVNQDCTVKICDFGLARTVDKPADEQRLPHLPNDAEEAGCIPHTKNMKRQLTGHVVTRWYRAPELILLQEAYTEAIDMWSVGCIFAELLNMSRENCMSHSDRGPLFPGQHSFPLSPDQKHPTDYKFHTRDNRDQLNVIFNVIGTPSDQDVTMLEKDDARKYVRIFQSREPVDMFKRFPASTADAVDLLKKMLVFSPNRRIGVNKALDHPLFADIRQKSMETDAPEHIVLPFDDWGNMNESELRFCFLKEVQRFHPEVRIPTHLTKIEEKMNYPKK